MKFNKFHHNSKKAFNNCLDLNCTGRALVIYNYINLKNINSKEFNEEYGKFYLKMEHNMSFYEYSYFRNKYIYYDYKNNLV